MKFTKTKRVIAAVMGVILVTLSCVACSSDKPKQKVTGEALYEAVTLYETYDRAHTVVRGVVKSKEKSFKDKKNDNPWWLLTPVKIEVSEVLKGENVRKTVTYNERGGENSKYIFESGDYVLTEGEEVIIFLYGDDNKILTPASLYPIKDGKVNVAKYALGNTAILNAEDNNNVVTADVEDFEELIKSFGE